MGRELVQTELLARGALRLSFKVSFEQGQRGLSHAPSFRRDDARSSGKRLSAHLSMKPLGSHVPSVRCCGLAALASARLYALSLAEEIARMGPFTRENGNSEGFHRRYKSLNASLRLRNFQGYRLRFLEIGHRLGCQINA